MGKTKRCLLDLLLAVCCVGLGFLLPWAFQWVNNGVQVLLLLQLPVLLCGMLCGPAYGLSCGLLIVLLPQFFPGIPGMALSTGALWELAIYGFLAGLFTYLLAAAPPVLNVSVSLLGAMLLGRVAWGAARLALAGLSNGVFTFAEFLAGAFTTAVPGIICHILIIPPVVMALEKVRGRALA